MKLFKDTRTAKQKIPKVKNITETDRNFKINSTKSHNVKRRPTKVAPKETNIIRKKDKSQRKQRQHHPKWMNTRTTWTKSRQLTGAGFRSPFSGLNIIEYNIYTYIYIYTIWIDFIIHFNTIYFTVCLFEFHLCCSLGHAFLIQNYTRRRILCVLRRCSLNGRVSSACAGVWDCANQLLFC